MQVRVINRRSKYFGMFGVIPLHHWEALDRQFVTVLVVDGGRKQFLRKSLEPTREQAPVAPPVFVDFFEADVEPARPFIDPLTCDLKVGDKVQVVGQTHGWGTYDEGDEAVVCRINKFDEFYGVQKEGERFVWKGKRECFSLLQEGVEVPAKAAPAPTPPKPKPIEPFPLGSEVRIAKESKYYTDGDNVMNPIDVDGEVTKLGDPKKDFYIQVCWGTVTNSYNKEDLVGV